MGEVIAFMGQLIIVLLLGTIIFAFIFGILIIAVAICRGFSDGVKKAQKRSKKEAKHGKKD